VKLPQACQLYCGRAATCSIAGVDVCDVCVDRTRAIVADAGETFDERIIGSIHDRRMVRKSVPASKKPKKRPGSRNKTLAPTRGKKVA
jgi:hypothetical protein